MKGFINQIKRGIQAPVNVAISGYYKAKTKHAQRKMIQDYVSGKPSKLSPENRSMSNVIEEKKMMEKEIRDKIKKKNPSLLK